MQTLYNRLRSGRTNTLRHAGGDLWFSAQGVFDGATVSLSFNAAGVANDFGDVNDLDVPQDVAITGDDGKLYWKLIDLSPGLVRVEITGNTVNTDVIVGISAQGGVTISPVEADVNSWYTLWNDEWFNLTEQDYFGMAAISEQTDP